MNWSFHPIKQCGLQIKKWARINLTVATVGDSRAGNSEMAKKMDNVLYMSLNLKKWNLFTQKDLYKKTVIYFKYFTYSLLKYFSYLFQ